MIKSQMELINVSLIARRGGLEVLLPLIAQSLHAKVKAYIIYRPRPGMPNVYDGTQVDYSVGGKGKFSAWIRFLVFCFRNRTKIIHTYNIGPIFLLAARIAKVRRLVYSIHGTVHWHSPAERLFLKLVWSVINLKKVCFTSNSCHSRDVFQRLIARSVPVKVVYNPIDTAKFRHEQTSGLTNTVLTIVYVGRLVNGKNLFKWLEIAKLIGKEKQQVRFKIFGEGLLRQQLTDYSKELGIADIVTFEGFVKDVNIAYSSADVLLFLSEFESFGNVAVESILCGTPVLVSDIPSMREIFENYPDFLVPLDDQIEQHVLNKINDIQLLKDLAIKASDEFRTRFSLEQHIKQIESIYESL